jgi:RHS repeat-associated protein
MKINSIIGCELEKFMVTLSLAVVGSAAQAQVLNAWNFRHPTSNSTLTYQSLDEAEYAFRVASPSYELAYWIPSPYANSAFSYTNLDYRVAGSMELDATLPPAEYGSMAYALWNQSAGTPWRIDSVGGCQSDVGPGYCSTTQQLASQMTANWSTPDTCVIQAAIVFGDPGTGSAITADRTSANDDPNKSWLAGGRIERGSPATQTFKLLMKVRNTPCSSSVGTTTTMVFPVAQIQHYVCPENWRVNLNPTVSNLDTYCIASKFGRGRNGFVQVKGANSPSTDIPPELLDKAFLITPPKDADTCPKAGNPCQLATGKKTEEVTDFTYAGITFQRFYDSVREGVSYGNLGPAWSHTFSARVLTNHLTGHGGSDVSIVYYQSERGHLETFLPSAAPGQLYAVNESGDSFKVTASGNPVVFEYNLIKANGNRIRFNTDGYPVAYEFPSSPSNNLTLTWQKVTALPLQREYAPRLLQSAINAQGRGLSFGYTTDGRPRLRSVYSVTESGTLVFFRYEVEAVWPQQFYVTHVFGNLVRAEVSGLATSYTYKTTYGGRTSSLLTGIAHEYGGSSKPFGIYDYDSRGRVSLTQRVGGVGTVIPSYQEDGLAASAILPLGATIAATIQASDFRRPLSVTTGTGVSAENTLYEYDTQGRRSYVRRKVDATQWSVTQYIYGNGTDIRPFEIIEAKDTLAERKTQTTWDNALNKPLLSTVYQCDRPNISTACQWRALKVTEWLYNSNGQVLANCAKDATDSAALAYACSNLTAPPAKVRRTVYTYCTPANVFATVCPIVGQLLSVDGPRTDANDLTVYSYRQINATDLSYRKGDLWKITNAVGHEVEYLSYDQGGRPLKIKDANAVETWMTYHPRGWLLTRTVKGASVAEDATTTFAYTAFGAIDRVTQPDGAYIQYGYDAAERMISMSDNTGNSLTYTLDTAGNRIKESTRDDSTMERRLMARQYDQLSRMRSAIRAPFAEQSNLDDPTVRKTTRTFDASGNQDIMTDPALGFAAVPGTISDNDYDPLNRLIKSLQDVGGISAKIEYGYDALNRLVNVKDPKNLNTVYSYDGLGNMTSQNSPDTGATNYTYDSAGNRSTQVDARGVTSLMTYDALNRLSKIEYKPAGSTTVNAVKTVQFFYDQSDNVTNCLGGFSLGKLTSFSDESGNTTLCYDRRGNVVKKTQITNSVVLTLTMSFNTADRLTAITYPSGTAVGYGRDTQGRVASMSINGASFINNVTYLPFGPVNQILFSNGKTLTKTYDKNYDIDAILSTAVGGLNNDYSVDEVGNIVTITQAGTQFNLGYDKLYRLLSVNTGIPPTTSALETFTYDATGNRLSKQLGKKTTVPYSYGTSNHWLTNAGDGIRTFDANGNTLATPQAGPLNYDERNRLDSGGRQYNARGERVQKTLGSRSLPFAQFMYSEAGALLTENTVDQIGGYNDPSNYIYMDGLLVARVQSSGSPEPIETDHLGTPRSLQSSDGSISQWQWNTLTTSPTGSNAFGEQTPSNRLTTMNLRFPGQYADENGLSYNYFRDYEPGTGRYVESDPIGLAGGVSTFGYVGQRPLIRIDPKGLKGLLSGCDCSKEVGDCFRDCATNGWWGVIGGFTGAVSGVSAGVAYSSGVSAGVAAGAGTLAVGAAAVGGAAYLGWLDGCGISCLLDSCSW